MTTKNNEKKFFKRPQKPKKIACRTREDIEVANKALRQWAERVDPCNILRTLADMARKTLRGELEEAIDLPKDFELPSPFDKYVYPTGTPLQDILLNYKVDNVDLPAGHCMAEFTGLPMPTEKSQVALEIIFRAEETLRQAEGNKDIEDALMNQQRALASTFWLTLLYDEYFYWLANTIKAKSQQGAAKGAETTRSKGGEKRTEVENLGIGYLEKDTNPRSIAGKIARKKGLSVRHVRRLLTRSESYQNTLNQKKADKP